MGHPLFSKHSRADAAASEFAATVASLPPAAGLQGTDVAARSHNCDHNGSGRGSANSSASSASGDTSDTSDAGAEDSLPAPADRAVEQRPTLSQVGRYALKGLLGQGGLGQVHEAWDPLLSRTVAVKTLQFDIDTPSRVSLDGLFLNEARAAAGLSHPHIVTVHDAGLSARGVYIAMERLHGCDLRQRLAGGWQPTPGQAAQLVRRVADALAYAHARGVVHCDIKPANIFLNRHDKPKVLDFGIARVAHGSALHAGLGALDGLVAGSPHYLAPEQLQGGAVDARTDIHALGVVFHELLAGSKAFGGDSLAQITAAVLADRPPPAHTLRAGVPHALSLLAARAMAREPADRCASAADMAGELRSWMDRQSAIEHATFGIGQALPKGRTQRAALAAAAAVTAVATAWLLASPARRPPAPGAAAVDANASAPATAGLQPPRTLATALAEPATPPVADTLAPGETIVAGAASATLAVARPAMPSRPKPAPAPARDARGTLAAAAAAAPATGVLQLAISPWGQVDIDGTPAGTTPPLTRLTLPQGTHTVTLRNDDFPPFTATVQVSADKVVLVRHRFAQLE